MIGIKANSSSLMIWPILTDLSKHRSNICISSINDMLHDVLNTSKKHNITKEILKWYVSTVKWGEDGKIMRFFKNNF